MEGGLNLIAKIKLYVFLSFCLAYALLSFFTHSIGFISAEPNTIYNYNLGVGDYTLTLIAASGTVASSAGGIVQINGSTVSGEESAEIAHQTPTTAQAYVNIGYEFSGWYTALIGGQLKTRNATFNFNMPSENTTFYAVFAINKYLISATSSPSGAGNITGSGTHSYNTLLTMSATPINTNYEFYRWIEGSTVVSTSSNYTFTVVQSRSLVAEFKVKLTASSIGGGSVTLSGTPNFTSAYFLQTQNVILEAIPNSGYKFTGWSSGSTSSSPTINVLVGTTAKTYVANFAIIGAELFVQATIGGNTIGSSSNASYPVGEVINLVANASAGYHFLYWQGEVSGNLQNASASTNYIVTLSDVVRGSLIITAVFERDYVALSLYAITSGVVSEVGGLVGINSGEKASNVSQMLPPEKTVEINLVKNNGYKFLGWYTAVGGGALISQVENYSFLMPINSLSYYALFQISYWHEYRISPAGDGSVDSPYIINTENELAWIAYTTNTGLSFSNNIFVRLNNNLNLSAYMWEPIGNSTTLSVTNKWQGSFNGGGYIISGLNINKQFAGVGFSGLFGTLYGANARVYNLGLENVSIIVSSNHNTYVGGIAGANEGGNIHNCYVKNAIIAVNNNATGNNYIGGIVGNNTNGKISNCYALVDIKTFNLYENSAYLGALVGNNYGANAVIENTYSISTVKADEYNLSQNTIYLGSLVGYNSLGAVLQNSYYSIEYSPLNAVGVNNSTENNNHSKTLLELKSFATYASDINSWDFEFAWLMPPQQHKDGYPILRGIGNLVVTAVPSVNGQITPLGQVVYFESQGAVTYVIAPAKNYEIETFLVNGEEQAAYANLKNASSYSINNKVGQIFLEATFIEQIREPIDIFLLVMLLLPPLLSVILILRKLFDKKFDRRRIIKGAIKKQKLKIKSIKN